MGTKVVAKPKQNRSMGHVVGRFWFRVGFVLVPFLVQLWSQWAAAHYDHSLTPLWFCFGSVLVPFLVLRRFWCWCASAMVLDSICFGIACRFASLLLCGFGL